MTTLGRPTANLLPARYRRRTHGGLAAAAFPDTRCAPFHLSRRRAGAVDRARVEPDHEREKRQRGVKGAFGLPCCNTPRSQGRRLFKCGQGRVRPVGRDLCPSCRGARRQFPRRLVCSDASGAVSLQSLREARHRRSAHQLFRLMENPNGSCRLSDRARAPYFLEILRNSQSERSDVWVRRPMGNKADGKSERIPATGRIPSSARHGHHHARHAAAGSRWPESRRREWPAAPWPPRYNLPGPAGTLSGRCSAPTCRYRSWAW